MAWPVPLPEATGDEVADLAAFLAWEQAVERCRHPERFDPDGERLPGPREFMYYLGVPEASWLGKADVGEDGVRRSVPKFVSAARLDRYRTRGPYWPVSLAARVSEGAWCRYAIDSGAYIALTGTNKRVPWFDDPEVYGGKILRFLDNNGSRPDFVACQDYPCEPPAQAATGLTVRDHQDLTCDSYEWLLRDFPMVPWIPVLQGEKPGDHVDHAKMYADRGIDLAACHRVGVGSICRLTELDGLVERITQLEDLAAQGLKLHGFGIKTDALPLIGHVLASADSMAWSAHVRHVGLRAPIRLPDCTHRGDCRNCYRYAVQWREKVLAALTAKQGTMPKTEPDDLFSDLAGFTDILAAAVRPARKTPRPRRRNPAAPAAVAVPDAEVTDALIDRRTATATVPLTFAGVCPACGSQTEPCPAEGPGDTWRSAEQWIYLAMKDHASKCPGRNAAGDPAKPDAIEETTMSTTAKQTAKPVPAETGDLFSDLAGFAEILAAATAKPAKKTAPRARRRKPAAPQPVVVPDDNLVDAATLAGLGPGTLFRTGGSSILTFDRMAPLSPGVVEIWTSTGWSFKTGDGERTLRVYTVEEAEYEKRLRPLLYPAVERKPVGSVKACEVAYGTFAEVTGMLPDGTKASLVGYVVDALTVVENYQGWTTEACMVINVAVRPHHLDGVTIAVPAEDDIIVLDTDVPTPGPIPLSAGTPAPWRRPTLEQLLQEAGLDWGPQDAPGVVTWRLPYMTRGSACPADLERIYLSECGGPAGNTRPVLKQTVVDKAIADGVWTGGEETGWTPVNRVRQGALGGLVDDVDRWVVGEFMYYWSSSHGAHCSPMVNVQMRVAGDDALGRVITVQVPATGAMFQVGATEPPTEPGPQVDEVSLVDLAEFSATLAGPAEQAAYEQGDLLADLTDFGPMLDALTPAPDSGRLSVGRTVPLAEVTEWGVYGEISAAWGPDGSRASVRRGYLIDTPRVYTGGIMDAKTADKRPGAPLLLCHLEVRANGSTSSMYCPLDATFTVLDPPDDHPLHAEMRLGRRLPFGDVRRGDVIYLWDQREDGRALVHRGGFDVADLRIRYHVQSDPTVVSGQATVNVLVDGDGLVTSLTHPVFDWVDVEDPREQPWQDATNPELVNPLAAGRQKLINILTPLNPKVRVLASADWTVVVDHVNADAATVSRCFGRPYRFWFVDGARKAFRPEDDDNQYGPIGGHVGAAQDDLNEVRQALADSTLEHYGLCLPEEDLPKPVWEKLHQVMRGMGATGGSRKGQPYDLKPSKLPALWAFIAGGPPPQHERTTAGWVRTPDPLAADVVARFADLGRLRKGFRMLEPSAGDGALIQAVRKHVPGADVLAVEADPARAAALRELGGFPVHERTFENFTGWYTATPLRKFDLIVMNPPYSKPGTRYLWELHVKLAWGLLAPGGRLVAILPGDLTRPDTRRNNVLDLVGGDHVAEQLPARSFRQRGKGGTDIDTWVLAATRHGTVDDAHNMYAASIYCPAVGDGVLVEEVNTSHAAANTTPVQIFHSFGGGDKVARFVGKCIVCTASCWTDGDNHPCGVLGMNAVAPLRADENGCEGPDVCLCWTCYDSHLMRTRGEKKARTLWTPTESE